MCSVRYQEVSGKGEKDAKRDSINKENRHTGTSKTSTSDSEQKRAP